MTTKEAAAVLGVSRRRVQAMIKAGRLRAVKRGRDWWVKADDIAAVADRKPGWRNGRRRRPGAESLAS